VGQPALADGQDFRELVQIAHLDSAVGAQHRREDRGLAGETAGVGADRPPGALLAADLEDDDGLAGIRGPVESGNVPLGSAIHSVNVAITLVSGSSMRPRCTARCSRTASLPEEMTWL
jgi:hypothetical protein